MSLAKYLAKNDEDGLSDSSAAALTGAGVTGAAGGAFVAKHELKDALENSSVKRTKGFQDFQSKLEPGDILFHHRSYKDSAKPDIGHAGLPGTEADYMMLAKGDPYYHASLYKGEGNVANAEDYLKGITTDTPLMGETAENIRAYRPSSGQSKALKFADKMEGTPYASDEEIIKHGLQHLFGSGGPKTSQVCGKDGQVCTQFAANAYPEIFGEQYASPASMRHAEDLSLIARYEPMGKATLREKALTRLGYPLLKYGKYGLGAAAATYGALKLAKYLEKDKK